MLQKSSLPSNQLKLLLYNMHQVSVSQEMFAHMPCFLKKMAWQTLLHGKMNQEYNCGKKVKTTLRIGKSSICIEMQF